MLTPQDIANDDYTLRALDLAFLSSVVDFPHQGRFFLKLGSL